jgi:hypothetical protein
METNLCRIKSRFQKILKNSSNQGLWILIHLYTLYTLIRIRIRLSNLMRTWIRILLLMNQASTPPLPSLKLLNFYFNADPDPAFHLNAVRITKIMRIHANPEPQPWLGLWPKLTGNLKSTSAMCFLVVIADFPKSLLKVSKFVTGEERLCG